MIVIAIIVMIIIIMVVVITKIQRPLRCWCLSFVLSILMMLATVTRNTLWRTASRKKRRGGSLVKNSRAVANVGESVFIIS